MANHWGLSIKDKLDMIHDVDKRLGIDERIVDHSASIMSISTRLLYLTAAGGRVEQQFSFLAPDMMAVANRGSETQVRSFGSRLEVQCLLLAWARSRGGSWSYSRRLLCHLIVQPLLQAKL